MEINGMREKANFIIINCQDGRNSPQRHRSMRIARTRKTTGNGGKKNSLSINVTNYFFKIQICIIKKNGHSKYKLTLTDTSILCMYRFDLVCTGLVIYIFIMVCTRFENDWMFPRAPHIWLAIFMSQHFMHCTA